MHCVGLRAHEERAPVESENSPGTNVNEPGSGATAPSSTPIVREVDVLPRTSTICATCLAALATRRSTVATCNTHASRRRASAAVIIIGFPSKSLARILALTSRMLRARAVSVPAVSGALRGQRRGGGRGATDTSVTHAGMEVQVQSKREAGRGAIAGMRRARTTKKGGGGRRLAAPKENGARGRGCAEQSCRCRGGWSGGVGGPSSAAAAAAVEANSAKAGGRSRSSRQRGRQHASGASAAAARRRLCRERASTRAPRHVATSSASAADVVVDSAEDGGRSASSRQRGRRHASGATATSFNCAARLYSPKLRFDASAQPPPPDVMRRAQLTLTRGGAHSVTRKRRRSRTGRGRGRGGGGPSRGAPTATSGG
jgi:hypothetical protein